MIAVVKKSSDILDALYRALFPYKPDPIPNFKVYFNVKNPKFEPFLRASEVGKKK